MKYKNITFVFLILVIVAAIAYLELQKVHPIQPGVGAQPIEVSSTTTGFATSSTSAPTSASSSSVRAGTLNIAALQALAAADAAAGYQPALEIVDPTGFVNTSSSFRLANLVGKNVILLDFWTYSCINCLRTIPYLDAWYDRYHDQGLQIVGIHTPEFAFEDNISNVQAAVTKYGIEYPVVMDSDYGTWTAYGNLYWPHEYLIDMAGYVVHDQVGEGNYSETEGEIQKLIAERNEILGIQPVAMPTSTVFIPQSVISGGLMSPETYFGSERNTYLANGTQGMIGNQTLTMPMVMQFNKLYLGGNWYFDNEYASNNTTSSTITYKYTAGKVYFVAAAPKGVTVEVLQDGKPVTAAEAGADVQDGKIFIQASRLYNLINNPDGSGTHILELIIDSPGLQAFTFTFG
ncbi:MAG: redoxin domain-containing protein [Minisyncoccia bacterium]|jgi:thiol-disulfide isomerase/thioredoxin